MKNRNNHTIAVLVMGLVILAMVLFHAKYADAQEPTFSIKDFTAGLVTNMSSFSPKYRGFKQFKNWDIKDDGLFIRSGLAVVSDSTTKVFIDTSTTLTMTGIIDTVFAEGVGPQYLIEGTIDIGGSNGIETSPGSFLEGKTLHEANQISDTTAAPNSTNIIRAHFYYWTEYAEQQFAPSKFQLRVGDTTGFVIGDSVIAIMDSLEIKQNLDTGKVTGLYAHYDRSGRKKLLTVMPSYNASNLWSDLMVSEEGGYTPVSRVRSRIVRDATPVFVTHNDVVYIAIEGMRPIIYDGTSSRPMTPRAPGQLEVTPISTRGETYTLWGKAFAGADSSSVVAQADSLSVKTAWDAEGGSASCCDSSVYDTSYYMDGIYRWACVLVDPKDTGVSQMYSYLTPEYKISSGRAVLYDFPYEALDSINIITNTGTVYANGISSVRQTASPATMKLQILRTKGYPEGGRPLVDTLYFVDEVELTIDSLPTYEFVDSLHDTMLAYVDGGSSTAYKVIIVDSTSYEQHNEVTSLSSETIDLEHYTWNNTAGSPQLIKTLYRDADTIFYATTISGTIDTVMWWDTSGMTGKIVGNAADSVVVIDGGADWVPAAKVDKNSHTDSTWVGTEYFVVYIDTLTGAASDSSTTLFVPNKISSTTDASDILNGLVLGIPPVGTGSNSGRDEYGRVLYRSMVYYGFFEEVKFYISDTTWISVEGDPARQDCYPIAYHPISDNKGNFIGYDTTWKCETIPGTDGDGRLFGGINTREVEGVAPYEVHKSTPYPVAFLNDPKQTVYIDTFTWKQLWTGNTLTEYIVVDTGLDTASARDTIETSSGAIAGLGAWPAPAIIPPLNGFTQLDDVLFGWSGSVLYNSVLDTFGLFRPFDNVAFGKDDGDIIVWAEPREDRLHVYKNFSSEVLFDPVSSLPTKSSRVSGFGCIAPHSYQSDGGRAFYLSHRGVIAEQGGEFKDYQIKLGNISEPINNLLIAGRSLESLRGAAAVIWDDKYILSIPETDTSFVYYMRNNSWGIWDFSFNQGTSYDSVTTELFARSGEVVIALDTDERVYKLGGTYVPFDVGRTDVAAQNAVDAVLQTGVLSTDNNYWQLTHFGVGAYTGTTYDTVVTPLGLMTGESRGNRDILMDTAQFPYDTFDYKRLALGKSMAIYPSFLLRAGDGALDTVILRSLDIWARPIAPAKAR